MLPICNQLNGVKCLCDVILISSLTGNASDAEASNVTKYKRQHILNELGKFDIYLLVIRNIRQPCTRLQHNTRELVHIRTYLRTIYTSQHLKYNATYLKSYPTTHKEQGLSYWTIIDNTTMFLYTKYHVSFIRQMENEVKIFTIYKSKPQKANTVLTYICVDQ